MLPPNLIPLIDVTFSTPTPDDDSYIVTLTISEYSGAILLAPMTNQTERPKATRLQVFVALFCGVLPYVGGFLVTLTRQIGWLALAGAAICVISTSVAYILRRSTDPVTAKRKLLVDPLLYGFEFVLAVASIRYGFMRNGGAQFLKMKISSPVILCVLGAISSFWTSLWARNIKVQNKPPASAAHLSLEQRRHRIRMASWIAFGLGCFFVVGAVILESLQ